MKIGSSLGRYRITSKLGEGGMGQVFRAEDDRLQRTVAIKVLPPELRNDRDRLSRMEREAHALAQLEHSNIAGIYGLEEATPEGESRPVSFLVMQFADGETLAARLAQGRVPVDEAIAIALQIARALEAAHDKGIVHRDLKPANIVLTKDGQVKLLDFGLAKAFGGDSGSMPPDISASPTVMDGTRAGMILGTAGYMSPEQARGKSVDRRTDVWAFGCVMFELLTGNTVFPGETVTDVLGAIVRGEPDWKQLPADTPPAIRAIVERCLRKDTSRRMQSIGDVRIALEEYKDQPPQVTAPVTVPQPSRLRLLPWAIAVLAMMGAAAAMLTPQRMVPDDHVDRLSVAIGTDPLTEALPSIAVAHDGRLTAFAQQTVDGRMVTIRGLDQLVGMPVTGTAVPYSPFFSPDGKWIGFVSPTELLKAPTNGGPGVVVAPVTRSRGATWTDDGTIIFAAGVSQGLSQVSEGGGAISALTTLDGARGEVTHRWPFYATGHDVVIFTAHNRVDAFYENATIEALNLKTRERKTVHRGGSYARYLDSGHLVFLSKNVVYAVPFDISKLEATGTPVPVIQDVSYIPTDGAAQFSASNAGLAVYRTGSAALPTYAAQLLGRDGVEVAAAWPGERTYGEAHISPDGSKISFKVFADNDWDLWVYDRRRQVATRLTFAPGNDGPGIWSPDSQYIAYSSRSDGGVGSIFRRRADGSGEPERLTTAKASQFVSSWSKDGKSLLYAEQVNGTDIFVLPLEGDRQPRLFLSTPFSEDEAAFSPDGRWIAYQSNESGRREVYVRPRSGAGKWQLSHNGGAYPRWSADGRQLFYRDNEGVMSVAVTIVGATPEFEQAVRVLKAPLRGGVNGMAVAGFTAPDYDVSGDGKQFLTYPADVRVAGTFEHVTFVFNWFADLRRMSPTKN